VRLTLFRGTAVAALPLGLLAADPEPLPGLSDLLRYGLLGIFLVLVFAASMSGVIMWGPSVKALVAAKDEQIGDLKKERDRLLDLDRDRTEVLNRITSALEERNRIDRESRAAPRRS
jgi:hypothetical protein